MKKQPKNPMKSILNIAKNAAGKFPKPASQTDRGNIAATVAGRPAASLLANLKQAQALSSVMIYSELMLSAMDDLHVHVSFLRRQKLGNLMRNTRKELEAMIHTFYHSSRVGRMDEATEEQFFKEINQVERVHKLLHQVPHKLLPAVERVLDDILKNTNQQ